MKIWRPLPVIFVLQGMYETCSGRCRLHRPVERYPRSIHRYMMYNSGYFEAREALQTSFALEDAQTKPAAGESETPPLVCGTLLMPAGQ